MSEELPPSERPPEPPSRSWEEEKEREKEQEKTQEKETEKGRGYEEKIRRDPLSAVFWAGILIMAGLVFLAANLGLLPKIGDTEPWHWIVFGAGVLLALEALVRTVSPDYARPTTGRLIFAGILMVAGLSGLFETQLMWPLVIVLIGVALLLKALSR